MYNLFLLSFFFFITLQELGLQSRNQSQYRFVTYQSVFAASLKILEDARFSEYSRDRIGNVHEMFAMLKSSLGAATRRAAPMVGAEASGGCARGGRNLPPSR